MNQYTPSAETIAYIAIAAGVILGFIVERARYNRAIRMKTNERPPSFLLWVVTSCLQWLGVWFYRLLIVFGLFFLIVEWYNRS